jgi:hypothetical protein
MSHAKKINPSVAHNYIPVSEDFTNSEQAFFTLTNDPENPDWDIVTYYTARRQNLYENLEGEGDSWVYILANKTMPNLLKIGFTNKTPDKRAEQISRGTGVPIKFTVEFAFKCFNGQSLENEIHKYLHAYRLSTDREFFQISLDEAKEAIILLGQRYIK